MDLLEKRILQDGIVLPGNILKVGKFLNHQIDITLLDSLGAEFARRFAGMPVTRILTIEASGIAVACSAARYIVHNGKPVPVVFAKKHKGGNIAADVYQANVQSFTHGKSYDIVVSKEFISSEDTVLVIDDFLANGCALEGLFSIIQSAGASAAGAGIVIEKGFQNGGKKLREEGYRIESLAVIESMSAETGLVFRPDSDQ